MVSSTTLFSHGPIAYTPPPHPYPQKSTENHTSSLNLSTSTQKLLLKILLLAQILERKASLKYPSYDFNCSRKRRIILLSALAVISKGLGLKTKLLQFDWLVDILTQILCKIGIEIAVSVVHVNGLEKLRRDLNSAQKLKLFTFLRTKNFKIFFGNNNRDDLKPFLFLLEKNRIERDRLKAFELRNRTVQKYKNSQLEQEIQALRLTSDDSSESESDIQKKRRFLHIWRCLLNYRLVKSRTRRRAKTFVIGKWRRSSRVSRIAKVYYGKKVKLSLINRWFHKRFGRTKERKLTR